MLARHRDLLPRGTRAVVTGGGSGLGRAFALALAAREGRVLVADIDGDGAAETAARVDDRGGTAAVQACDVRDPEAHEALALRAESLWGGADLLINNAGVAVTGKVGEVPVDDWRYIVEINLMGMVWGCEAFVPRFRERGAGAVLNVASAAGLLSPPLGGPYNVTKAGVIALSETLAAELRGSGVGVTVLCPTFFPTNLMEHARASEKHRDGIRKVMARSRLSADDVARAALRSVARGEPYSVPMADGRRYWWLKRMTPEGYLRLLGWSGALRLRKRSRDRSRPRP